MHEALEKALQNWNLVSPVIDLPKNNDDYQSLLVNIRDAITLVENRPNSPLASLIKIMARVAKEYEGNALLENGESAILALRYLIRLHGVKQSELSEVGSQGVVSEILSGKRTLTLRHVIELSRKFNVSPSVFIDI